MGSARVCREEMKLLLVEHDPPCKSHPYYRQSGSELILTAAGQTWAVQSQIAFFFLESEVLTAQCTDTCMGLAASSQYVQCKDIGERRDCTY